LIHEMDALLLSRSGAWYVIVGCRWTTRRGGGGFRPGEGTIEAPHGPQGLDRGKIIIIAKGICQALTSVMLESQAQGPIPICAYETIP
jgi:hypothetical protein